MHDDYERIRGTVLNDYVVKYRLALGLISTRLSWRERSFVTFRLKRRAQIGISLSRRPFASRLKAFQICSPFLHMSPKFLLLLRFYSDWSFDWRNYRFGLVRGSRRGAIDRAGINNIAIYSPRSSTRTRRIDREFIPSTRRLSDMRSVSGRLSQRLQAPLNIPGSSPRGRLRFPAFPS